MVFTAAFWDNMSSQSRSFYIWYLKDRRDWRHEYWAVIRAFWSINGTQCCSEKLLVQSRWVQFTRWAWWVISYGNFCIRSFAQSVNASSSLRQDIIRGDRVEQHTIISAVSSALEVASTAVKKLLMLVMRRMITNQAVRLMADGWWLIVGRLPASAISYG